MIFETVPTTYAQALLDLTASDFEKVASEFEELVDVLSKESRLLDFFSSPLIKAENKVAALEKSMRGKVNNTLVNFLCVLAERDRLSQIAKVYEVYRYLVDRKLGMRSVSVTTAFELDASAKQSVESSLQAYFNSKLHLYFDVEPNVIGGVLVRSEGQEIDATILRKIENVRSIMKSKKFFGEKYYEN